MAAGWLWSRPLPAEQLGVRLQRDRLPAARTQRGERLDFRPRSVLGAGRS